MRRLTLILSDLYLPAEAGPGVANALDLPNLERLLSFAEVVGRVDDWRRWLTREVGAGSLAQVPLAHIHAIAAAVPLAGAWLATPVHLEARLDHVRLSDRGMLRLSPAENEKLALEFARTFGPELNLRADRERDFLLSGGPIGDIRTVDPARLLDSDIGGSLPDGSGAGDLRRLATEIEMWLPTSGVNVARERAGQKPVTSLWLWGGGGVPTPVAAAMGEGSARLYGGDPYVIALNNLLSRQPCEPAPAEFAALVADDDAYVALAPMSGPASESMSALEARWFAPARTALAQGGIRSLRIVANDRLFEVSRRAGWKFWRRRQDWLVSLGHAAKTTKA